ncbi:MAG: dehydrogenase [Deinococcus-Thermus bacterium]|nr:dehydrogenase [Deinococcota bacterium]
MSPFRVALSGDFRHPDGRLAFPDFDLSPLADDPDVEITWVQPEDGVVPAAGLADTDALILLVPRFDARSVPADGRLAVVARFGVGYDSVDLDVCTEAGIAVCTAPDGVRRPVAVSILTFVLALSQKLLVKDRLTRRGPEGWARLGDVMGQGLVGRTLGQLGMGSIGAEVFRIAAPLGMRFIAHDPFVDPALAAELGVELVSLEEVFRQSDFLSVSVPSSAATRHLVNAERLALMKPTAYLVNTARGPVVDQKALYRALVDQRIAGAGLDVFEVEPAPADEPLLALDNVVVTPHALCWTDQCFAGIGAADVAAVRAVMRGRTPRSVVNAAVLQTARFRERLDAYRRSFGD